MGSETTAAAIGNVGQVRRDPMAMLPFCGYNMGDYFRHWFNMRKLIKHPPRIFHVNWFRKDEEGRFSGPASAKTCASSNGSSTAATAAPPPMKPPSAGCPGSKDFDLSGMKDFGPDQLERVQEIGLEDWRRELISQDELFMKLYSHLPKEMIFQRELLVSRL